MRDFDCVACGKAKKDCECDPMGSLYEALDKFFEVLRPPGLESWQCMFCSGSHSDDMPCAESLKAKEESDKRHQEHARHSLEDPVVWPPQGTLVKEWTAHGLRCCIANTRHAYCAYVHLPEGHPDEHKTDDELDRDVTVHGGLSFRQKAEGGGSWFGFDFAHGGDWVAMPPEIGDCAGKMWEVEEVVRETEHLAEQLAARADL